LTLLRNTYTEDFAKYSQPFVSNSRVGSDEKEQSSNSGRQLQMLRFDYWTTVRAMNSIIYSNCEFRSHSDRMDSRQKNAVITGV